MRNLKLILFCCIISLSIYSLNGCSSDDNGQSITQSSILGKWYSDTTNPDNITLNFMESGMVSMTYVGAGNNGQDVIESCRWSISGNTLKFHFVGSDSDVENWSAEILTLTNSVLKWKEKIDGQFYNFSFHR